MPFKNRLTELSYVALCVALLVQSIFAANDAHDNSPGHTNDFFGENIFTPRLAYATVLVFCCAILTAGAGIGGGVLFLPIYVIILGLEPHFAVPLSKATIVGVSYGGFLVNYRRRHPLADRPLIDYDTALVMQPMLLVGTIIGVLLNVVFPKILIIILLIVLLLITCFRTMRKGWRQYQDESKSMDEEAKKEELSDPLLQDPNEAFGVQTKRKSRSHSRGSAVNMVSADSFSQRTGTSYLAESIKEKRNGSLNANGDSGNADDSYISKKDEISVPVQSDKTLNVGGGGIIDLSKEVEEMLEEESKTPWAKFIRAIFILLGLVLIYILKGGSSDSVSVIGVECGSVAYWLILAAAVPYLGVLTLLYAKYLIKRERKKEEIDFPFVNGDIRWTPDIALKYPLFACFAGTAAGCLGIGGGLVLGPLLLEIGMYPPVVSATSAFTIIFTSTSITVQFLVLQRLDIEQGLWFCCIGFIGAILGHLWVKALLKKYKKASLVSLILGFAVGLSAVVIAVFSIDEIATDGVTFDFHTPCDPAAGA